MTLMSSKQIKTYLGRSLIKNLKNTRRLDKFQWIHSEEFYDGSNENTHNLRSVLEDNALEELLSRAEKANQNYDIEQNLQYIGNDVQNTGITNDNVYLRLPRRPHPIEGMDARAWARLEENSFTDWRRFIANHVETRAEKESLTLTPFEKNIQVWRQLWRVIERSDVVVQIVDARDVNFYRNLDLECYVLESGEHISDAQLKNTPKTGGYELDEDNIVSSDEEDSDHSDLCSEDLNAANETQNKKFDAKVGKKVGDEQVNSKDSNSSKKYEGKINLLLINKSDLLSQQQRDFWRSYLTNTQSCLVLDKTILTQNTITWTDQTLVVFFSAKKSTPAHGIIDPGSKGFEENDEDIFNPDELIQLFRDCLKPHFSKAKMSQKDESKIKFVRKPIFTVGFVGYPNVGKSSTINALLKVKKVAVSATPGKTKHLQTHLLPEKDICLCDCPGLVMPNFVESRADLIVHGVMPIDTITDPLSPIQLICNRVGIPDLNLFYGNHVVSQLAGFELHYPRTEPLKPEELLTAHSIMRGFTTTLAQPDFHRSARIILKDYVNGRLVYCHAPPNCDIEAFQTCAKPLHLSKAQMNALEEALNHKDLPERLVDPTMEDTANPTETLNPCPINASNKRNLLDPQVEAEAQLDNEFFGSAPSNMSNIKGISCISLTSKTGENVKTLNPGKKHFNKNKREKLRRLNPNPW